MKKYSNEDILKQRRELESRLTFAIKVKATLEEYKKYCAEYYYWPCDGTEEKLAKRRRRLAIMGDDFLLTIVNDTYLFAGYLLRIMKEENNTFGEKIFTTINYQEDHYLNLGCTGGHFTDELYRGEYYGREMLISRYILKSILNGLSLESDYDFEERMDGDICCLYTYPKLTFNIEISKFNEYYGEFFENRKRTINL